MPQTILTDLAVSKIEQAAGSPRKVAITHVALGDGGGHTYEPTFDQSELRGERVRKEIDSQHIIDQNMWRIKVKFGPDTTAFEAREVGFFDEDGDLISVWAGLDVVSQPMGVNSFILDHVLVFKREVDGVVIVDAPDDDLYALALTTGVAITQMQLEQLRQADRIRAEHGGY